VTWENPPLKFFIPGNLFIPACQGFGRRPNPEGLTFTGQNKKIRILLAGKGGFAHGTIVLKG
jgi:hypothetical protein